MNAKAYRKYLLWVIVFYFGFNSNYCAQENKITIGERVRIHSKILNENRSILVYQPGEYLVKSYNRYPVLYLLDGTMQFNYAAAIVKYLSEMNRIPKMIVVGIENVDRTRDYTPYTKTVEEQESYPTSGAADKFSLFIQKELVPFIDSLYRTQNYNILSGWSFGGLFAREGEFIL